jgi:hypothetical protein
MVALRTAAAPRSHHFFATRPPELPLQRAQLRFARLPSAAPTAAQERALVDYSLRILDLALFSACLWEALIELEIGTAEQLVRRVGEVDRIVEARSGREIGALVGSALEALTPANRKQMQAELTPSIEPPPVEEIARFVHAVVVLCPIVKIEEAAKSGGLLEKGHLCRESWSRLRAWLARNDPRADTRLRVLGDAYARGALTASEVGAVLGLTQPDAVGLLQSHGHCRDVDTIRLDDAKRSDALAALRGDRQLREGQPRADDQHARRDVVASSRIERVDVQKWMTPAIES